MTPPAGRSGSDVERTLDDLEGEIDDGGPPADADPRSAVGVAVVPATSPPDPDLAVLLDRFFSRSRDELVSDGVGWGIGHGVGDPDGVWWRMRTMPDLGAFGAFGFDVRKVDESANYAVVTVEPPADTPSVVDEGTDAIAARVEAGRDHWRAGHPADAPQPWARGDE